MDAYDRQVIKSIPWKLRGKPLFLNWNFCSIFLGKLCFHRSLYHIFNVLYNNANIAFMSSQIVIIYFYSPMDTVSMEL
jgi:hypothetical protein